MFWKLAILNNCKASCPVRQFCPANGGTLISANNGYKHNLLVLLRHRKCRCTSRYETSFARDKLEHVQPALCLHLNDDRLRHWLSKCAKQRSVHANYEKKGVFRQSFSVPSKINEQSFPVLSPSVQTFHVRLHAAVHDATSEGRKEDQKKVVLPVLL